MKQTTSIKKGKLLSKNIPPAKSISASDRIAKSRKSTIETKGPKTPTPTNQSTHNSFTVVAIGASAGGLEAITQLLQNLSPSTGMAYIYVQHLSPDHKSILDQLLSKTTKMKVQDIEDMEKMEPDNVYIIPYNKGIEVTDGHIKLIPRSDRSPTLSIDILFTSLAETHHENVIGVVLSGSAHDGTQGLKEIKMAGGITFAQDDSAKFTSMPHSAIAEGVVDFILSPKEIAQKLTWMSKHPLVKLVGTKRTPEDEIDNNNPYLRSIIQLLLKRRNVDFSQYKMNTIKRRMLRRMVILKITTLKHYAEWVEQKKDEVDMLYEDLLINVTEFFRDPETFLYLKKTVLPRLIKSKTHGDPLRIWVAACATGEEVYSIAMLLFEIQDTKTNNIPFQIFASDLSAEAINEARNGEYSIHQLKNVSNKRIQRFFTRTKDKYRISKSLRDVCIFAPHNILRDPPFSRMDFISCRNLLIYLDTAAQKKAIATFHYALNDNGCLMLGKSETIGTSLQLFSPPLDKKSKIYIRKKKAGAERKSEVAPRILQPVLSQKNRPISIPPKRLPSFISGNLSTIFDTFLLTEYTPASVVINHDLEILQFRGETSLYLQNSNGKASLNILKMAHIEITFELRNAIHHAIKTKQKVSKTGIEMNLGKVGNHLRIVNIEVTPLRMEGEEDLLVIAFTGQHQIETAGHPEKIGKSNSIAKDRRIKKLEEEIAAARHDMASITQDQEAANEELQSANEEIVSSNEELQSLNEELETSKEEIESTNEELITTNQELQVRIQQVEELYNYYETILSAIHEPMLVLNKDMRIKSANKAFCKAFHVDEEDSIGISLYKLSNSQWNIPQLRELLEDIVPKNNHFHDFELELDFPTIGSRVLLLNAHRIIQQADNEELIVLTIIDITEVRRLSIELQLKEKRVLEVQLEAERKALKEIEESNNELLIAKGIADSKTVIAENAVRAKQQFLSNMSHEIRTPMNAIIGFTHVVLKTKLDKTQKEYLNAIKVSGDALIILINDILDLAKVDAGKMVFDQTEFNLSDSISTMLQLFEPKIKEKNLTLLKEYDESIPEILIGDPLRLRQIILNLVGNSVKFTHNGRIIMRIGIINEDAKNISIEFTVEDTGIGIAGNKLEHIFNSFEQVGKGTSYAYGGSGLGLAIVKQLVERQGGTIAVTSKEGKGSAFSFILNFRKGNSKPTIEKNNEQDVIQTNALKGLADKKIKILIVEDVVLNQLLLKIILLDFGFDFNIAENGKIAIDLLQKNKYDLILMDLQMPEMNGFEATSYIRKKLKSAIPIIALTADVTTVDIKQCIAVGMNDYISKPINEKILLNKMTKYLKKKK
ncbi:response regulator [Ferruginibacter lapsinanis]|uniref:CheR family methyltransferase n=1 Tax=Ferruginibacter lapsinanis TaxID=563172 RepID=UPI001E621427|nr:CheR family methyltransferase [Ferruginibacter lapsinanis]UEG49839.1 response regulator [Ferruginibacter lapsinanis]